MALEIRYSLRAKQEGRADLYFPPEDVFPLYEACVGIFNFNTLEVEYLYRTESYSIDLKNEPQYIDILTKELINKIP